MKISYKRQMRRILQTIRKRAQEGGMPSGSTGLCFAYARELEFESDMTLKRRRGLDEQLRKLFISYPLFSGNTTYPLPGGYRSYSMARSKEILWSKTNLKKRLDFLDWAINELKK